MCSVSDWKSAYQPSSGRSAQTRSSASSLARVSHAINGELYGFGGLRAVQVVFENDQRFAGHDERIGRPRALTSSNYAGFGIASSGPLQSERSTKPSTQVMRVLGAPGQTGKSQAEPSARRAGAAPPAHKRCESSPQWLAKGRAVPPTPREVQGCGVRVQACREDVGEAIGRSFEEPPSSWKGDPYNDRQLRLY